MEKWHVGQGNGEGSVFADAGRMRLESGGTTLTPICKVFDFDGDMEDHARLIAAAPTLLEACQGLLEMITDNRLHGPEVYQASDAIKHAEGRE